MTNWRDDERSSLRRWRKAGHSDQYIADKLGRTRNAVRHQRRRLGLSDPPKLAWTASKLRKEISERQLRLEQHRDDGGGDGGA